MLHQCPNKNVVDNATSEEAVQRIFSFIGKGNKSMHCHYRIAGYQPTFRMLFKAFLEGLTRQNERVSK